MRLRTSLILASFCVPLALTQGALAEDNELKVETHKAERAAGVLPDEATYLDTLPDDALMTSGLIGSEVRSAIENDESIGEIKDVVINPSGEIVAIIVGVGGYLGGGEKNVAIEWSSVELDTQDGETTVRLNSSKDALEAASAHRHY